MLLPMWSWARSLTGGVHLREKARPWLLVSAPLMAVTGILLFTVPRSRRNDPGNMGYGLLQFIFFPLHFTIYNMSHSLMVPLSTRNTAQRGTLSVFTNVASVMVSGIIVALIFPMAVLPALGVDKEKWILVMSGDQFAGSASDP